MERQSGWMAAWCNRSFRKIISDSRGKLLARLMQQKPLTELTLEEQESLSQGMNAINWTHANKVNTELLNFLAEATESSLLID